MIDLTVAIPMFNAGKIGWLALESLARQENVDFEWELVIAEEQDKNMLGHDKIMEYEPRLKEVGCQRLKYVPLKKWIPLPMKWKMLASDEIASESSKIFTFVGADNYNYKDRLKVEHDMITVGLADWVSSLVMPFLFIQTGEIIVADYKKFEQNWKIHAGMAFSTPMPYAKHLTTSNKKSGIDGWLFGEVRNHLRKIKKAKFEVQHVESDYWKYGFGTHGLNNISGTSRYNILKRTCLVDNSLSKYWPSEVMTRLEELKNVAKL